MSSASRFISRGMARRRLHARGRKTSRKYQSRLRPRKRGARPGGTRRRTYGKLSTRRSTYGKLSKRRSTYGKLSKRRSTYGKLSKRRRGQGRRPGLPRTDYMGRGFTSAQIRIRKASIARAARRRLVVGRQAAVDPVRAQARLPQGSHGGFDLVIETTVGGKTYRVETK